MGMRVLVEETPAQFSKKTLRERFAIARDTCRGGGARAAHPPDTARSATRTHAGLRTRRFRPSMS